MKLPSIDFTKTNSYSKLQQDQKRIQDFHILDLFREDSDRFEKFSKEWSGLFLDFSKNLIDDAIFENLLSLAKECQLDIAIKALYSGVAINETENRAVMHMALRAPIDQEMEVNRENVVPKIHRELEKMEQLASKILNGEWLGFSGKKIRNIVNIGIGGSDLGPQMVTEALKPYHQGLNVTYVSNVDPHHLRDCLENLDPETTLILVASKTFTTIETMSNAKAAKNWLLKACPTEDLILHKHFIALSNHAKEVRKFGIPESNQLEFWDWVGGRVSLWSAVGFSTMLAIGIQNFRNFLQGGHDTDEHFRNSPFKDNIPIILALIDVWNQNFLGCDSHAVIPYYQHLWRFPAYLQQLEMESNGKSTDRSGKSIGYQTGRIIWGETGTNGQHAFFQLIHQGTKLVPVDFIGVIDNDENQHTLLLANLLAQSKALMEGTYRSSENGRPAEVNGEIHKQFNGCKPNTTILLDQLSPEQLGKLIALYEHKIFVQGVIWNIFSFDQWGVELGKKITLEILPVLSNSEKIADHPEWDSSTRGLIQKILLQRLKSL